MKLELLQCNDRFVRAIYIDGKKRGEAIKYGRYWQVTINGERVRHGAINGFSDLVGVRHAIKCHLL